MFFSYSSHSLDISDISDRGSWCGPLAFEFAGSWIQTLTQTQGPLPVW